MLQQSALNLHRAYPHALDLHHVVGAADIPVIATRIAVVLIARAQPVTLDGFFRLLMLIPVSGANRIALDKQIADLAIGHRLSGLVDDASLVSVEDLTARAGPSGAGTVGNEHVQSFGRADRVQYLDAKPFLEAVKQRRRQSFAGGNCATHAGKIKVRTFVPTVDQQRGVIRRDRVKEGRLVAFDHRVNVGWRGRAGPENIGRAYGEPEVKPVAQAVGEEKFSHAEGAIAFRDAQYAFSVSLGTHHHVVMQVNTAFGPACASRRVEPEGGVILVGGLSFKLSRSRRKDLLERMRALRRLAVNDDCLQIAKVALGNGL